MAQVGIYRFLEENSYSDMMEELNEEEMENLFFYKDLLGDQEEGEIQTILARKLPSFLLKES